MYDLNYYFPDNHYPYGWQVTKHRVREGLTSSSSVIFVSGIRRLCSPQPQVVDVLVHAENEVLQEGDSKQLFVSPGTGTKQLHVCTHEDRVDGRLHDPHLDQGEPLAPWIQAAPSLRHYLSNSKLEQFSQPITSVAPSDPPLVHQASVRACELLRVK